MLKESTPSILCFYFRFFKPVLDGQVSIIIVSFSNVLFAQNFWTSYQLKVYFFFLRFLISEILSTFKHFLLQFVYSKVFCVTISDRAQVGSQLPRFETQTSEKVM